MSYIVICQSSLSCLFQCMSQKIPKTILCSTKVITETPLKAETNLECVGGKAVKVNGCYSFCCTAILLFNCGFTKNITSSFHVFHLTVYIISHFTFSEEELS